MYLISTLPRGFFVEGTRKHANKLTDKRFISTDPKILWLLNEPTIPEFPPRMLFILKEASGLNFIAPCTSLTQVVAVTVTPWLLA